MNSFQPIPSNLIDVTLPPSGYPTELAAGDTRDVLWDVCGDASRDFPASLWREPKEWPDIARENDENNTWAANYIDRFTNQNPNHFCTCHSLGTNFEACRNRQRGIIYPDGAKAGFRYAESATAGSVWVSPMSIYAEANPREWGGASTREVLDIGIRRGFLPDKTQPKDYGFKHTLTGTTGAGGMNQSRGAWTPLNKFPSGWQETAKHFRIQEVIFPETAEQVMCLLLAGYSVCVGRNGHAVPYTFANVTEKKIAYNDSYDLVRWDSWRTVQGCANGSYAICSVSTPDDWSSPAN